MKNIHILGTGNATVTKCYNTCFALELEDKNYLLVDGGGGNGILARLEEAKIDLEEIGHIFISHAHSDHLLGVVWLLRVIALKAKRGGYPGKIHLYGHDVVLSKLETICSLVIGSAYDAAKDQVIVSHVLEDRQEVLIEGHRLQAFDLKSTKEKQFGMVIEAQGKRLAFLGDEPYKEHTKDLVEGADWLMHEAFCLYEDRDQFKPYEKSHATVKDACETAQTLGVKQLILYHTEDTHFPHRQEKYLAEGQAFFTGALWVPNDGDVLAI